MKRISVLIVIMGLVATTSAWAGSLTVTNTFQGGQKALASEVNTNFDDVEREVTFNANDIASNANSIIKNAADIASNAQSISDIKTIKLDALTCSDGQVLKYNAGTSAYECADDLDTNTTLPHTHTASDITGPITADNLNGFDASTIRNLIDVLCSLYNHAHPVLSMPGNLELYCKQTVFITSLAYDGDMTSFGGPDAICQDHADNAGLFGTYKAWITAGDAGTAPVSSFFQSIYPYVLVDGTTVAANWNDLVDGSILNAINMDEFGSIVPTTQVWTNTLSDGTLEGASCSSWTTNAGGGGQIAMTGNNNLTDFQWTDFGNSNCDTFLPIYCFQQ